MCVGVGVVNVCVQVCLMSLKRPKQHSQPNKRLHMNSFGERQTNINRQINSTSSKRDSFAYDTRQTKMFCNFLSQTHYMKLSKEKNSNV